jgi:hypothetical protein
MGVLSILVNGRAIDTFKYNGGTYVEGRKGKPYIIKYKNNSNKRQKIIVAVDGLNVMSGDSTWDRGYVVDAYGSIEIPGWRKDSDNVAAFEFSSVRNSYNNLNDNGDTNNVGVIGCKVFNEKEKPQVVHHHHDYWPKPYVPYQPWPSPHWAYTLNGAQLSGSCNNINLQNSVGLNSIGQASYTCSDSVLRASGAGTQTAEAFTAQTNFLEQQNSLGTGWGENTEFKTQAVYADWEYYPSESHVIYYDDRRGLEKRGIRLEPVREYRIPKAFPDGCPPPKSKLYV